MKAVMTMAILPRYVMVRAWWAMFGAVMGLWLLQLLFAYLSELQDLSDSYSFVDALWYIFYRSPYFLVQFMPTGALLGAVIGLGLLAGNSELVIMRASGVSIYRIVAWAMVPAFLFVVLALAINQFVLPTSNQKASDIITHQNHTQLISVSGYWAVDNHDDGMDITYIGYADSAGNLGQVKRYQLDKHANLSHALSANQGTYYTQKDNQYWWQLTDSHQVAILTQGVKQSSQKSQLLTLPIAPENVHLLTKNADDLSLTDLYAHRQLMKAQSLRSRQHELSFWQKLFSPLAILSLVLVATSFVFGSMRSHSLGLRIVMALLTGLLFGYLSDLSGFVALATNLSPLLMALLPIVLSGLVGLYLLHNKQ